jgi:hypothetical protein
MTQVVRLARDAIREAWRQLKNKNKYQFLIQLSSGSVKRPRIIRPGAWSPIAFETGGKPGRIIGFMFRPKTGVGMSMPVIRFDWHPYPSWSTAVVIIHYHIPPLATVHREILKYPANATGGGMW